MTPTSKELRKGTDHIHYEMNMLVWGGRLLSTAMPESEAAREAFAIGTLEVRLLHARNLMEFFDEHRRRDNLNAREDYGLPYEALAIKDGTYERISKELAHLSMKRIHQTEDTQAWRYEELDKPIIDRSIGFVEHLLQNKPSFLGEKHPRKDWEDLLVGLKTPPPTVVTHTSSPPPLTLYPAK